MYMLWCRYTSGVNVRDSIAGSSGKNTFTLKNFHLLYKGGYATLYLLQQYLNDQHHQQDFVFYFGDSNTIFILAILIVVMISYCS